VKKQQKNFSKREIKSESILDGVFVNQLLLDVEIENAVLLILNLSIQKMFK
jgi:hypothetical protein